MACIRCGYSYTSNCPYCRSSGGMPSLRQMRATRKASEELGGGIVDLIGFLIRAPFYNKYLCFVTFVIAIVAGFMILAPTTGLTENFEATPPTWYILITFISPIVAAITFRKHIPKYMSRVGTVFYLALACFVIYKLVT